MYKSWRKGGHMSETIVYIRIQEKNDRAPTRTLRYRLNNADVNAIGADCRTLLETYDVAQAAENETRPSKAQK